MSNLLLSMLCAVAFVAFSNAKVLRPGPQPLEEVSSPLMPQKHDKRYATQVITLYLTPSEMKALTEGKDTENSELQIQEEQETQESDAQKENDQQQLKAYNQYNKLPTPVEEQKAELRGLLTHHSFYPKEEKSTYENQQWNYNFANSYSEQKPRNEQKHIIYSAPIKNEQQDNLRYQGERKTQQESALEKESQWTPIVPESAKEVTEQLYEQLKQQGNIIFNQNGVQLKALSTIPKEYENTKETNTEYNVAKIIELNSKNEDKSEIEKQNEEKSEIEKQIELILRHEQAFEEEQQRNLAQAEANKQRLPIIIHKEVSVTKHLPVPVLRKVKIPTPVLVPIPEPYEVKIPHPYPVPYKVIKHIPVPVIRHY